MHPSWPTTWQRLLSVLHHPSARMALVLGILLAMVFSASTVYLARQQTVAEYQEYANNLADYAVQRTERVREYTFGCCKHCTTTTAPTRAARTTSPSCAA